MGRYICVACAHLWSLTRFNLSSDSDGRGATDYQTRSTTSDYPYQPAQWSSKSVSRASAALINPSITLLLPTLGIQPSCPAPEVESAANTDRRTARNSRPLEVIGTYDPIPKKDTYDDSGKLHKDIKLDVLRAKYWIGVGAQPTETAWRLLSMVRI